MSILTAHYYAMPISYFQCQKSRDLDQGNHHHHHHHHHQCKFVGTPITKRTRAPNSKQLTVTMNLGIQHRKIGRMQGQPATVFVYTRTRLTERTYRYYTIEGQK